ncbi:siderophore ABC transporter permease [Azorhizobium oxalatiphilum]|uniref:Siderophore ABC transporter permease n=2 Tax=Azorhizobium oxalatiphilum TaxID=980631 RepID=A0A917C7J0_9HYPH|nr:siderophore ABC transporter permease [Azorhizobium oxalatiphilum]
MLAAIWAVTLGSARTSMGDVVGALIAFDGSREHLVIMTLRLPRVLAGLLVGAALAVAGAIMQAATHNPLASPGLMGINAGAAFAVVMVTTLGGATSGMAMVGSAFGGATAAAGIVLLFASAGPAGATPLRLVLAGAVLTAFITSLTTAVLIFDQSTLDQVRLWSAGSLSGRTQAQVAGVAPFILAALGIAILLRAHITTLSIGSDMARAVGQDPRVWRGVVAMLVIGLAGGAVALAGPIGFVGLVVPHLARFGVGVDYRWIIPFSALAGALLVVLADAAGRTLLASQSFPVGVTMALIGGPFFVWLARTRTGGAS